MSPPQAVLHVLYPKTAYGTFDMEYYLQTHMPLVEKHWGPQGLKEWTVTTLDPEVTGFRVQALLLWDSAAAYQGAAFKDEVFGDIPNFTNIKPVQWIAEVKAVGLGAAQK
ncbi:hypothetical protein BX600DRAFT_430587 [Xylariales sp. PMI_506]|nr:hypothetical protein BX600DRAFT_430587 [Xylariales sp. PMI_506]